MVNGDCYDESSATYRMGRPSTSGETLCGVASSSSSELSQQVERNLRTAVSATVSVTRSAIVAQGLSKEEAPRINNEGAKELWYRRWRKIESFVG